MANEVAREEVARMMRQYDQAYRNGDIAALRRIRHPECVFTSSRGERYSREEELTAFENGNSRIDEVEVLASDVRVVGDTAFVLQRVTLAGMWSNTPFSGEFSLTITWAKTPDGWRVVADHASAVQG